MASGTTMTSLSTNERHPLPRFTTSLLLFVFFCVRKDVVVVTTTANSYWPPERSWRHCRPMSVAHYRGSPPVCCCVWFVSFCVCQDVVTTTANSHWPPERSWRHCRPMSVAHYRGSPPTSLLLLGMFLCVCVKMLLLLLWLKSVVSLFFSGPSSMEWD